MKRHLAPLPILVFLLLAGSSLWFHSHPASVTGHGTQVESPTDPSATPSDNSEITDDLSEAPQKGTSADNSDSLAMSPDSNKKLFDTDSTQTASAPTKTEPASVQTEADSISNTNSEPAATPASMPTQAPAPPEETEQSPTNEPESSVEDPALMIQELLAQINEERSTTGASSLVLDSALSSVAQLRAEECTTHFGHTRPNGTIYRTAVTDAGISYQHLGENLATGQSSPQSVMQSWDNSDGHHDNIVNEDYTKVGIGLAKNTNGKYDGYSWVVVFSD